MSAEQQARFESEALEQVEALMGLARRLTRNDAEAEDLVQDTFLKALRAQGQFQPGTNLRAWLMRILRNAFINRYHRGALEKSVLGAAVPDPVADGWLSSATMQAMRNPEAATLRPELERSLSTAVDALPPEFREVILLADVEEFSYKEIAEMTGCPIGTVMSRLHRARKLLKASLIEHARDQGIVKAETDIGAAEPIDLNRFRKAATEAQSKRERGK